MSDDKATRAQLREENASLIREIASLKRKLSEKEEEVKRANEEAKRARLSSYVSKSFVHAYDDFNLKAKALEQRNLPDMQLLSASQISEAWSFVKGLELFSPTLSDESSIQTWFNQAIPKLIHHLHGGLVYLSRKKLSPPLYEPDGILCCSGVASATTWEDVLVVFEFQSSGKGKSAWGQCVRYLSIMMDKQFVLGRRLGLGVFSDWSTIRVFMLDDVNPSQSPILPLFSQDSIASFSNEPTEGFAWLCHILSSSPVSLGYHSIPKTIHVHDEDWNVVKLLGQGADSVAYCCMNPTKPDQHVCVKLPIFCNPSHISALKKEAENIEMIQQSLSIENQHIVSTLVKKCSNALVTWPVGSTLTDCAASLPLKEVLLLCLKWLDSLRILHQAGFVHNDAQPDNAIVFGKHVVLIDFQCPSRIGITLDTLRCAIPQIPARWIQTIIGQSRYPVASPMDDIEQFVYGVSRLLNKEFVWMRPVKKHFKEFSPDVYCQVDQERCYYFARHTCPPLEKTLFALLLQYQTRQDWDDSIYEELKSVIQRKIHAE